MGSYTFTYDALDRVSSVQEPFGLSLTFGYDGVGDRTSVQDSLGGVTTSVYDAAERLSSLQFHEQFTTAITVEQRVDLTYTAGSQIASETRYNSVSGGSGHVVGTSLYAYDAAERLTTLAQHNGSGGVLMTMAYSYDAASRLTVEQDSAGGTTTALNYSYDNANQLVNDGINTYTGGITISYDAAGNRTNNSTVNADNQLTSDGTWDYYYDENGNEIEKVNITAGSAAGQTWKYTYDGQNRMFRATEYTRDPDTYSPATVMEAVDYTYDVFGNRIEQDVYPGGVGPPVTQRYAYDGWNPAKGAAVGDANFDVWADLDGGNHLETRYLRGDAVDQLFARVAVTYNGSYAVTAATGAWLLTDRLGSVRAVTDASGTVIDTIAYDGWGNILPGGETDAANGGRYKWTGREEDISSALTGLQYNRGRYYDSTTGRWTTEDPLGYGAGDSNLYRYVNNQPTIQTDPSGLDGPGLRPPVNPPPAPNSIGSFVFQQHTGSPVAGLIMATAASPLSSILGYNYGDPGPFYWYKWTSLEIPILVIRQLGFGGLIQDSPTKATTWVMVFGANDTPRGVCNTVLTEFAAIRPPTPAAGALAVRMTGFGPGKYIVTIGYTGTLVNRYTVAGVVNGTFHWGSGPSTTNEFTTSATLTSPTQTASKLVTVVVTVASGDNPVISYFVPNIAASPRNGNTGGFGGAMASISIISVKPAPPGPPAPPAP